MASESEKLTPEQIRNWRNVLFGVLGPLADTLPDSDIQTYRDRMQAMMNSIPEEKSNE